MQSTGLLAIFKQTHLNRHNYVFKGNDHDGAAHSDNAHDNVTRGREEACRL